MLIYLCTCGSLLLVCIFYDLWILAFISSWIKDEQRGKRKKDEQRGKWKRHSCLLALTSSSCASLTAAPLPVSATCDGSHLAPLSHTTTTAAHSTLLLPSPGLPRSRVLWLYRDSHHRRLCCRLCLGFPGVACRSRLCDLSCLQCNTRYVVSR